MTVLFYGCNFRGRLSNVPDVRSAFVKLRTGANSGVSIFSIKQSSREVETKKSESSSREISKCFFYGIQMSCVMSEQTNEMVQFKINFFCFARVGLLSNIKNTRNSL